MSALGDKLFLDSGTLTPLLKRMEAAGLITRRRAVEDERRVNITLTAQGQQLKRKAANIPVCILAATQCPIPEVMALTQQLQALRERLAA